MKQLHFQKLIHNFISNLLVEPQSFDYDSAGDILYVSFTNRPETAIGDEIIDGVVLRRSISDDMVIGFTIIDFIKRLQDGILDDLHITEYLQNSKVKSFH